MPQFISPVRLAFRLITTFGIPLIFVAESFCGGFPADDVHYELNRYQTQAGFVPAPAMLVFFNIKNGRIHKAYYSAKRLSADPAIVVDGYVAGIVALSEAELDIYFDGRRMRKVAWQKGGGLSFRYFGKLDPEEIFFLDVPNPVDPQQPQINHYHKEDCVTGYSFFPKITGDAVSAGNRFRIAMATDNYFLEVAVHQNGYRDLPPVRSAAGARAYQFRYIGDKLNSLNTVIRNYEERIRSVVEGIAEVEEAFRVDLVQHVNLIDCDGLHNALTRAGHNDLWFFLETIQNETVSELKIIARHEALHLVVDRYDFTRSTAIRKIFSNLKRRGGDSYERLFSSSPKQSSDATAGQKFFAFINEKNFFSGAKGGHSQDNLNEFCSSLLHSLMYPDLIGENLDSENSVDEIRSPRGLNSEDKNEMLALYSRLISALIESVGRQKDGAVESFLETRSVHVDNLINDFRPVESMSSSN
ncbi:MAG: hypothetical protein WAL90_11605 [Desulfobacterales bacterium]